MRFMEEPYRICCVPYLQLQSRLVCTRRCFAFFDNSSLRGHYALACQDDSSLIRIIHKHHCSSCEQYRIRQSQDTRKFSGRRAILKVSKIHLSLSVVRSRFCTRSRQRYLPCPTSIVRIQIPIQNADPSPDLTTHSFFRLNEVISKFDKRFDKLLWRVRNGSHPLPLYLACAYSSFTSFDVLKPAFTMC